MCKFCDDLSWRKYMIPTRNEDACDNLCEVMTAKFEDYGDGLFSLGSDCENCDGCNNGGFGIHAYENRIGFSYSKTIKELHIGKYSEMLDINYCPWCGKRLTDKLIDFEKCMLGMQLDKIE